MLCRPVLCQDERQIAAEAEGLRHVWHSGVYCATPRWSCPHMKNMNHPRKLPQRAECPDTWGSDRDRPEAPEIDRTQKRTGDKTSLKRRDHPCTLLEKSALLVLKHAGGWPPHTPSVTVFTGPFSLSPVRPRPPLPCCNARTRSVSHSQTGRAVVNTTARLRSERMINAVHRLPLILTLWSAAAGCNDRMPMSIGSFSYTRSG